MARYNRASLDDTIRAARSRYRNEGYTWTLYIYATAYGYTISTSPPPATQQHVVVYPDGTAATQTTFATTASADATPDVIQPRLI